MPKEAFMAQTDGAGEATAKKKKKRNTKDLILAGAFAALYVVLMLVIVMGSSIISPVLYILAPLTVGTVTGTVYTLAVLKARSIVPVIVMGGLFLLLASSTNPVSAGLTALWTALACAILVTGKFKSKRVYNLSFIVYNLTMTAPFAMLAYARETFISMARDILGDAYADSLAAVTPNWIYLGIIGLALAGGVIGALLANKLIAKHFAKAGIVN